MCVTFGGEGHSGDSAGRKVWREHGTGPLVGGTIDTKTVDVAEKYKSGDDRCLFSQDGACTSGAGKCEKRPAVDGGEAWVDKIYDLRPERSGRPAAKERS